jgi:periplasmic protein TonB
MTASNPSRGNANGSPRGVLATRALWFGLSLLLHLAVLVIWLRLSSPRNVPVRQSMLWIQLASPPTVELPKQEPLPQKPPKALHRQDVPRLKPNPVPVVDNPTISPVTQTVEQPATRSELHDSEPTQQPVTPPVVAPESPSPQDYPSQLATRLEQVKRYPDLARTKRQQGVVWIVLRLTRLGQVLSWRIERGSGYPALDQETGEMVDKAAPFPPFPASMSQQSASFLVPIEFTLR